MVILFIFLRYDDKLKFDFKDFMLYYEKDLTIDFINNLFNKIYKVLGEFFCTIFLCEFWYGCFYLCRIRLQRNATNF